MGRTAVCNGYPDAISAPVNEEFADFLATPPFYFVIWRGVLVGKMHGLDGGFELDRMKTQKVNVKIQMTNVKINPKSKFQDNLRFDI